MGLERPKALNGVYSEAIELLREAQTLLTKEGLNYLDACVKLTEALDILEPTWRLEP